MPIRADWNAASLSAKLYSRTWGKNEPGGVIIGFDPQGVKFAYAGGLESLATGVPFTANTVVRYASITKHIFCAMVLHHADVISLNDRLGDHLPELQSPLADVSVGRALDMTAGLPDVRECLTLLGLSVYTHTNAESLLEFLSTINRLNFNAGSEISYSNTGYRLVEAAFERKGLFFKDFVKSDISDSIDVPNVWADPVKGLAPGYWKSGDKWQESAAGLQLSASGSLAGSGMALTKWAQTLLEDQGSLNEMLSRLSTERFLNDGRPTGYGLGLRWNEIDGKRFIGHGGSHPGYKSYFMLDPAEKTGMIVVSNREDADTYKIARDCMAALNGLDLPDTSCTIPDGLYVTEAGPFWIEMREGVANYLGAEDRLYNIGDDWFSSLSPSSPMKLRWTGDALQGEIGHVARELKSVIARPAGKEFDGQWAARLYGASFTIDNGHIIMGIGPTRQVMPLEDLGNGRALFTLRDGPWNKRICIHMLDKDRLELVLNRSRMIEYQR
ncbi:serine hydrolase domain-containing protein [Ochrobactrum sp. AN78]|uniref:serine hydrolase domain-containing protein n=1 Tax=Ochrobactrum sp. AN78 TaxID=3039853 RepID=UPI002989DC64|nr:serine hydrolase domain-containing protein [Ochrobactrum sp. AN78]MDH7790888.1 CubicO group peptidase (beta-lactamase class C family) [Ochrobactrum sp. AN78]